MKKVKMIIIGTIVGSMFFSACKKEEGCISPDATNFNNTAEVDDGSCTYSSEVVFWWDESTATSAINDGSNSYSIYINNALQTSSSSSVYWTSSPDCGSNGSLTLSYSLGGDKSKTATYKVIDQDDIELWSGSINFNANTCLEQELVW